LTCCQAAEANNGLASELSEKDVFLKPKNDSHISVHQARGALRFSVAVDFNVRQVGRIEAHLDAFAGPLRRRFKTGDGVLFPHSFGGAARGPREEMGNEYSVPGFSGAER
jgi:hypothetical protein